MSRHNVAVVRAIHAAWERGESPATLGLLHADIEYVNPPSAVEPGTRRGIAAYEDALRSMDVALEDVRVEAREFIDAGDQVVVLATFSARGRSSGVHRQHEDGYVWTVRDGKAVRFQWFNHPAEALQAAGLQEEGE
jgi:uncharacterized protein